MATTKCQLLRHGQLLDPNVKIWMDVRRKESKKCHNDKLVRIVSTGENDVEADFMHTVRET